MLGAWIPLLAWPILCASAGKPPVNVELRTSWQATPILLESLESVAIEEPSAFFHLLDAITDPSVFPLPQDKSSPKHAHQHVFDTALAMEHLAAPGAYVAAEMHVALHSASPKLEAFYQYYNDHHAARKRALGKSGEECESWVDWYGEVVCDAKQRDEVWPGRTHVIPRSPRDDVGLEEVTHAAVKELRVNVL